MKRTIVIAALSAIGLTGCGKEAPKPVATPAPTTSAPAATPAAADAMKDAAKTATDMPKAEAAKAETSKDAKK